MKTGTLAALVVVAGLAGALAYYTLWRPAEEAASTELPPLPEIPPASPTGGLVATLPDVQLHDRAGQLRSLAEWQGKSLVVNFWATWCAPCRREIPLLQQIARERAGKGFEVVGIAVDFRDAVLAYADEMQIEYPVLIGEQEGLDAVAAFGIEAAGFPFTVFSDAQGRIVALHMGELHEAEADVILRAVDEVNAGRSSPEQARAAIEAGLAALPQSSVDKSGGRS